MRTIHIDYESVQTNLTQMRNHIATNINQTATEEYRKISNDLMQVDGAVQNELQHVMELSRKRALAYTSVIERVQSFRINASFI